MSDARVIFAEDFCAEWRCSGGMLEINLWGAAELATQPAAAMAMNEARAVAEMEKVGEVRVDIRAVDFMAAPVLKYFVDWFAEMQDTGTRPYKVSLVCDAGNRWQARVKDVLCSLAPDVLTAIEGKGPIRPPPTPP
jgi:hypothetical protein